jgi:3D (Asp-Asp-Asp) domain-containing protein
MLRRNVMIWVALALCMLTTPLLGSAATFVTVNNQLVEQPVTLPIQNSYTVRAGDTLWELAKKLGTSVQNLMAANEIQNPQLLQIGDKLTYTTWPGQKDVNMSSSQAGQAVPSSRGQSLSDVSDAKLIHCTLTAYTAGYESTGKSPGEEGYGLTSTGTQATQGVTVAVDPSIIPYGTKLYIPGIGYRVAEDTGGAIIGDHVDIFYDSLSTARNFGVKHDCPVYILPDWYHIPMS